jgi:heme A synthase
MTENRPEVSVSPRWLHRWAVLTVCATLPLLLLGAEVTTKQVGMVDPVGFREPWHLLRVLDRAMMEAGFLIEHSHRLVGFVVGTCVIVLAAGLWARGGLRWLGLAALAAICIQGLLGGFRVNLNALMGRNLALIHGCFAQLVFALLVSISWVTSRAWSAPAEPFTEDKTGLRRWSLITAVVIYLQLILGGLVRHRDLVPGARSHLLVAFGVVALVAGLAKTVHDARPRDKHLTHLVYLLVGLVGVQLLLGVESWMGRFSSAEWHQVQPLVAHPELLRSLHYLVGSGLFATSVLVALQAHRQAVWASKPAPAPVGHLEGVA